jgi:hypothetical protein
LIVLCIALAFDLQLSHNFFLRSVTIVLLTFEVVGETEGMNGRNSLTDQNVGKRRLKGFVSEWAFLGNQHFLVDSAEDVRTVHVEVEGVLYLWENGFRVATLLRLQNDSLVNSDFAHG